MKTRIHIFALFFILSFALSSCLTVATKEYTIVFDSNNSGTLTIKYINLISQKEDGEDVSEKDYKELIDKYFDGQELEKTYNGATNFRKRLYVENNQLCAEIKMDFIDLKAIKIFQLNKKSQYIMNLKGLLNSESYVESNGVFAGEEIQLVLWDRKSKVLTLKTKVTEVDENCVGLANEYSKHKK